MVDACDKIPEENSLQWVRDESRRGHYVAFTEHFIGDNEWEDHRRQFCDFDEDKIKKTIASINKSRATQRSKTVPDEIREMIVLPQFSPAKLVRNMKACCENCPFWAKGVGFGTEKEFTPPNAACIVEPKHIGGFFPSHTCGHHPNILITEQPQTEEESTNE